MTTFKESPCCDCGTPVMVEFDDECPSEIAARLVAMARCVSCYRTRAAAREAARPLRRAPARGTKPTWKMSKPDPAPVHRGCPN